jgi:hypothetical protein
LNECFYAATSGDLLDLYIIFTQIGQQIFNVPEHLVGSALAGFPPASGVLKFQEAEPYPSPTKTEQVGIAICPAEEIVPDDLTSDDAEGDAVPSVTQRKIGVRKPGMDTDVGKAVFRFAESACPGISYFQWPIWKQSPKLFHQGSGLLRNQRVTTLRINEVFVFAADDDTSFGGGPQIKIWRAAFPNEALLMPS